MNVLIGKNGFLARALGREAPELKSLGSFDFNLLEDSPPRLEGVKTIIYAADYYPGLEATAKDPVGVWKTNLLMYEKLFAFAKLNKAKKVITIGTSACYPVTSLPLDEEMFDKDPEKLNPKLKSYALSRFSLMDLAALYPEIVHHHLIIPNFYGPGDKYELGRSHLLSSWIRDFSKAKATGQSKLELWGDPHTRREFMYIGDVAKYVLILSGLELHREVLNVGYGLTPTYQELAKAVCKAIGWEPDIHFDRSRPNPRSQEVLNLRELSRYQEQLPEPFDFQEGVNLSVADFKERYG